MVVRPITAYAALVWWPRTKLWTSRTELRKLQRVVCLGVTGAMSSTPTAAVPVLLGPLLYML